MDLTETQALFADVAWSDGGDLDALARSLAGPSERSRARLDVYAAAVRLKMAGRLRLVFEKTASLLGDERFLEVVADLARSSPPAARTADSLARRLPGFLRRPLRGGGRPDLPDLARLERARADVVDEPRVPPMAWDELVGLAPAALGAVRFRFVPEVRLVRTRFEVADLWGSLDGGRPAPLPVRDPAFVLVWRSGSGVSHARLDGGEGEALSAALSGAPLEGICRRFAAAGGAVDAWVDVVRGWFGAGFVASSEHPGFVALQK